MKNPPDPPSSRVEVLWSLFEQARELPSAEREAFVRGQTQDGSIANEVLLLLGGSEAPVPMRPDPGQESAAPSVDKVQSTATDELLKKLATAPTLDTSRFAVEGELGKGGMGVVMKIYDQHLHRRLAMKVLIERAEPQSAEERRLVHQLLGRFLEEAQVTSQLDHPGVVPVHELGLDQSGRVYFTMRLVKGRTAREVFADAHAEQNDWTVTRALEVILKVCDTMSYAHEKGVLHRDLKPSNVMVGRFGEVYVMDWGLAKVVGHADRHDLRIREDASAVSGLDTARQRDAETDSGSSVVSMDGDQLGTPSYMAPEQARSEELDGRADVYSIGAMMYELLTGRAPYTSPGVRQPAYRILNDVVEGPPKRIEDVQKGVPAELVAIVERAMHRERDERYKNVLELAADVRAFLAQRVVLAYRTGALVEMKLWVRRNRALASSLAVAVLILVAGIVGTTWLASENAGLAQQKTELAASEAAQAKLAAKNESTATERATEAERERKRADNKAAEAELNARELETLLATIVLDSFRAHEESRARFAGQHTKLAHYGAGALRQLLAWLEKPPPQVNSERIKMYCIEAIRDFEGLPDVALVTQLKMIAGSASESKAVVLAAGAALAQFGDRSVVDPWIEALNGNIEAKDEQARALALNALADLYYNTRDYSMAAATYKRHIALVEATAKLRSAVPDLANIYYNACCSMALAGLIDEAFSHLDRALEISKRGGHQALSRRVLEADMDIAVLRKDQRFAEILKKLDASK